MNWWNRIILLLLTSFVLVFCNQKKQEQKESENDFPKIELIIGESEYQKLKAKRDEALKKKVLISGSEDLVEATISINGKSYPCKIRLKGDWTSHLKGEKWSFRVELRKGEKWLGMSEFSLQNPVARHYLSGWVWHKMLEMEGLLTTEYFFSSLSVNDSSLGVYAVEEHFTKAMLERNQLPKGLIVKMEEDLLWEDRVGDKKENRNVPFMAASEIDDYGGFKGIKQYEYQKQCAFNLLFDYKFCSLPSNEIFDPIPLSKYLAIVDLHRAYHTLFWHNQRFYYNPKTQKLNLIGYDGFTEKGPWLSTKKAYLGQNYWEDGYLTSYKPYLFNLFNNKQVYSEYIGSLKKFSDKRYITAFLNRVKRELKHNEQFIKTEYTDYSYDSTYLFSSAEKIRMALDSIDEGAVAQVPYPLELAENSVDDNYLPREKVSVRTYFYNDTIAVYNYYYQPILPVSVSYKNETRVRLQSKQIPPFLYKNKPPAYVSIPVKKSPKWLYYQTSNSDSIYRAKIENSLPPNYPAK